jgi:peptide-methionine (S)-S-oxide reductase
MGRFALRPFLAVLLVAGLVLAGAWHGARAEDTKPVTPSPPAPAAKLETATFGLGCFWCAQALFEKFQGVDQVVCGYAGGHTANPTYEDVCSDQTGHAEVVQITYDPAKISYSQLLEIFWDVHDPTTLNQQGPDEGTQYRSIILYNSPKQKELAEASKSEQEALLKKTVTTQVVPLTAFYRAEEYHQDYFKKHPHAPYCLFEISPKVEKLEKNPPQGVKLIK